MIDICSFSVIIAYVETGGDNEENVKKQVVVHLTLQEYKVSGMIKLCVSLAFLAGGQLVFTGGQNILN